MSPTRADQITSAAHTLFAERGYEATSIAAIARSVGVADGAIYRHFDSKRDVLNAVIVAFYEPLIESALVALRDIADPRDRLRTLVRHNLAGFVDDPLVCRLIIAEARVHDGYYESSIADLSRRYTSLAVDAVADGISLGIFDKSTDPAVVRDVLFGAMEHMAWASLTGHGSLDIDSTTNTLVNLVIDGISVTTPDAPDLDNQLNRLETLVNRFELTGGGP